MCEIRVIIAAVQFPALVSPGELYYRNRIRTV